MAGLCSPRGEPGRLPRQVALLVMRADPDLEADTLSGCRGAASGFTRISHVPTRCAGTGNVPSRNILYAVCG